MDWVTGAVGGDVLANTTAVGMHPAEGESPVAAEALVGYQLVFDAVYTPLQTQLLKVHANSTKHFQNQRSRDWILLVHALLSSDCHCRTMWSIRQKINIALGDAGCQE